LEGDVMTWWQFALVMIALFFLKRAYDITTGRDL
jgi:hypothetical protein